MSFQSLRLTFEPVIRRVFHFYARFARGMTLGTRAVVLDGKGHVFLVKHSYVAGWHRRVAGLKPARQFPTRCGVNFTRRAASN